MMPSWLASKTASLRERKLEALLWRNLSILATDLPLPHTLADLEWQGANRNALDTVADKLNATEVAETLARIERWV